MGKKFLFHDIDVYQYTYDRVLELCRSRDMVENYDNIFADVISNIYIKRHKLNSFESKSSPETFLTSIIRNAFLDILRKNIGRYQPSAQAKKFGQTGIKTEKYIVYYDLNPEQIFEKISQTDPNVSQDEINSIFASLTANHLIKKTHVCIDDFPNLASENHDLETSIQQKRKEVIMKKVSEILADIISCHSGSEKLILSMRFNDEESIANISSFLSVDKKEITKLIDNAKKELKKRLEAENIDKEKIKDYFSDRD